MILVDTGSAGRAFRLEDREHRRSAETLRHIREPPLTTVAVLTEAFHMLCPDSIGSDRLRDFVERGGLSIWFFDRPSLTRAFELMEMYADHPMDLADASPIAAGEGLGTRKIFTSDHRVFETYRIRRGHRMYPVEIVR
jgi:predicted nucleic acid-binding protein